ncbi:MAG: YdeI/OmpD-associated family protein [Muribaculaceae bacterium]|nr:YdeI/OmpD-associated family protein [Muribaculaceae bacterium]
MIFHYSVIVNQKAWNNFKSFPELYQRVRIDNVQRVRKCKDLFDSRLKKLIDASERGEMYGEWNDGGRLLDY